jgi:predicted transposase YdaD
MPQKTTKQRSGGNNDHDSSYKLLFTHPEMVESLIRDFVPEEWVQGVDFSSLKKTNQSYAADDLRDRHDDIIWKAKESPDF